MALSAASSSEEHVDDTDTRPEQPGLLLRDYFLRATAELKGRRNALSEETLKSSVCELKAKRLRRMFSSGDTVKSAIDDWETDEIKKIMETVTKGRRFGVCYTNIYEKENPNRYQLMLVRCESDEE